MKALVRGMLGAMGLDIFRARGGIFLVPKPRAGRAGGAGGRRFDPPLRLHLGCGNVRREGWVNIDLVPTPATDLVGDVTRLPDFADGSVEEIRMEAVYEHLFRHERLAALREWHRVLAPGGLLHIAFIPDFDVIAEHYVNRRAGVTGPVFSLEEVYRYTHGDPVAWNAAEQLHKDVFTRESVTAEMVTAGFEQVACENVCYRDESIALNLNVTARKRA